MKKEDKEQLMKRLPFINIKDNKVIFKIFKDESFVQSCIIPTDKFPSNENFEIFSFENTKEVENPKVIRLFNSITYKVGKCYTNSQNLLDLFKENDIEAKMYAGWLFLGCSLPVHHCWLVFEGNQIIDLSNDVYLLWKELLPKIKEDTPISESRKYIIEIKNNLYKKKNSDRCFPFGKLMDDVVYVGSECKSANEAREIYNNLMRKYPYHECYLNCNDRGLNITQMLLYNNLEK